MRLRNAYDMLVYQLNNSHEYRLQLMKQRDALTAAIDAMERDELVITKRIEELEK